MNFLQWIQLALGVISAVHTIESVLPMSDAGKTKLDTVLNVVQASATATGGVIARIDPTILDSFAAKVATDHVSAMNTQNVFKTTP
jgi:hypothetical protein